MKAKKVFEFERSNDIHKALNIGQINKMQKHLEKSNDHSIVEDLSKLSNVELLEVGITYEYVKLIEFGLATGARPLWYRSNNSGKIPGHFAIVDSVFHIESSYGYPDGQIGIKFTSISVSSGKTKESTSSAFKDRYSLVTEGFMEEMKLKQKQLANVDNVLTKYSENIVKDKKQFFWNN